MRYCHFIFLFSLLLLGCAPNSQTLQNQSLAETDAQLMVLDLQNHNAEAARLHLQQAQALAAQDPQVLVAAGYFDEKMGNILSAQYNYKAAIALSPHDSEIENDYGTFLYQQGEYAKALPYFIAATQDPENTSAAEASENAGLTEMKLQNQGAAQHYFAETVIEMGS